MFALPFASTCDFKMFPDSSMTMTVPLVTESPVMLVTLTPIVTLLNVVFKISTVVTVGIFATSITVTFSSGVPIALLLVALLARYISFSWYSTITLSSPASFTGRVIVA